MADAAAGLLVWFAKALGKKAGAAVFQEKYGEHVLYKETIGPQEVELSEVSLKKVSPVFQISSCKCTEHSKDVRPTLEMVINDQASLTNSRWHELRLEY